MASAYDELIARTKEASLLGSTAALLGWDQETMMPAGGVEHRSRQLAQLARLTHQMATDPRIGALLAACEADSALRADPTSAVAANVRELRRQYDRQTKLPTELVEEFARTTSLAKHEWVQARQAKDFARFRPWLEKIVGLVRRKAECYGWPAGGEPWDALAEGYEPGCTAKQAQAVFDPLRPRLSRLIGELTGRGGGRAESNPLAGLRLPVAQQVAFVRVVAERMGFDFARGRLDVSAHPFCSGTHCHDVRLTTRYDEAKPLDALSSVMHEAGHGLYEQGLPAEHLGTPRGHAVSLGIHESQSRLWENFVGRSRGFWAWCLPTLSAYFGPAVHRYTVDDFYRAANLVRPDFIRVEADELTYNLHIVVRFELERALVKGELAVADLPGAWNQKYQAYLGLEVPDDAVGVMQDIHWSMGALGYFPTYTLGNLYAAQFFETAQAQLPDLPQAIAKGEFAPLKGWLNRNIHSQGMRYRAAELCAKVTGKPLSAEPLLRHLEGKLRPLYA